jgi:hypothetical protein
MSRSSFGLYKRLIQHTTLHLLAASMTTADTDAGTVRGLSLMWLSRQFRSLVQLSQADAPINDDRTTATKIHIPHTSYMRHTYGYVR